MLDRPLPDTEQKMLRLHVCGDTFDLASVGVNHPYISHRDKRYWWANPGIDWSSATTVSLALSATALGVSVGDAQVREGPDAALAFRVTLDRASAAPVTVDYATQDGTAVAAAADYTATSGTLTFVPGETAKTVTVAVFDDAHDEGAETLTLTALQCHRGAYRRRHGDGHDRELGSAAAGVAGAVRAHGGQPGHGGGERPTRR